MKVCYLADAQSIHTQRWVKYFANKGHEVHIITFENYKFDDKNITLHHLKVPFSRAKLLFKSLKIRKIIKKIKPDILHAHFLATYGVYGAFSGFHPFVVSAWGSDVLIAPKRSNLSKFFMKHVLKKADIITSVAIHMTKSLVAMGANKKKIVTFPMGIDPNKFNPNVKPTIEFGDKRIVISTRSLNPIYNLKLLIRAIPFVIERTPETRFLIIGDGPQKDELIRLSKELKIDDYIKFLGAIPQDRLPQYLVSSDVYVSTSLSDGTSVSLLEGMACGAFPIVTDIPANREWIKNGENGFLVPTDNPRILAKSIIKALSNRDMGEITKRKNWRFIKENAIWKKNMKKMEDIYDQLLEKYDK